MAFTQEESIVPAAVGDISVIVTDFDGTASDSIRFEVQVLQSDGSIFKVINGDLLPHLTSQQISGLVSFMASLRTKAVDELLP